MKSHCFCESDLVGKEQANSPRSPLPSERSLLVNCFPCKSDSAPFCVQCRWLHAVCLQGRAGALSHTDRIVILSFTPLTFISSCPQLYSQMPLVRGLSCRPHSPPCVRTFSCLGVSDTHAVPWACPARPPRKGLCLCQKPEYMFPPAVTLCVTPISSSS